MRKIIPALFLTSLGLAQTPAQVDIELMTYAEIHDAIHKGGKTTVLIYNGGTEQRGPHAALGGHTFIAHRTGVDIARKLGNALLAPVMPFSPADGHLNPNWPGTVTIPMPVYLSVNEAAVKSMATNGFRHIVLMGDHGGGQKELEALAARLDTKLRPKGVRVYFCGAVYRAYSDFNDWLKKNNLPVGTHAGVSDTSLLMYLDGPDWIRKDKLVNGNSRNGINGDPRPSTAEIGRTLYERKVSASVDEIRKLIAAKP
ncbi:MAG: creatininase family protein [Bryobacteraceae bacterium]